MQRIRAWLAGGRDEHGSQGLEAAAAALAAALIVLALLAGARTLGPAVEQAFQCAAAVIGGGGGGCGGGGATVDGTGTQPPASQNGDRGDFSLLDGLQLGLDVLGLVPVVGELADGTNALISLARGDYGGAALSATAMIPFAGWAATGGKFVRTGVRYSDEAAALARNGDEAATVARRIPCVSAGPPGKGPGLAKPLASCVNFDPKKLQAKFKHASDFGVSGNFNKANADLYRQALEAHLASPNTQVIKGTYRGTPVEHHFDPTTGLNVIVDTSGEFVSGWRLSPDQITYVTTTGNLGGG